MKTNNANWNSYFPVNYVDTDGPSGERRGAWWCKENSLFTLQPQKIIQGMKNKYENILPTISFPQRVHLTGN